jgi:hypothetical protein
MKLTREEREQVKARIGEMIAGEPIELMSLTYIEWQWRFG